MLPACQKYGTGVIISKPLAGGWLTGRYRKDGDIDMTTGRARRLPHRFDPSLPGNQAKLAAVEELIKIAADAGCSLIHLALAFVTAHQGVTSAIIGPRTMDQLTDLVAGASVTLDDDVLDRIDQIVPPGTTVNPADAGWQPPALTDPAARRRPRDARAVGLAGSWALAWRAIRSSTGMSQSRTRSLVMPRPASGPPPRLSSSSSRPSRMCSVPM